MKNIIFENSIMKWNAKERKYEKYNVPQGWNLVLYTENMDEHINCCQCGRKMRYGEAYTSLECHNSFGMGYGVCDKCYDDEWQRKRRKMNKERIIKKRQQVSKRIQYLDYLTDNDLIAISKFTKSRQKLIAELHTLDFVLGKLEEVAKERDLYKSVIEEVREYILKYYQLEWHLQSNYKNELLQILDKAKDVK